MTSFFRFAVLLWTYSFLAEVCTTLVEAFGKVGEVVYTKVTTLRDVDFSALQLLPLDWDIKEKSPTAENAVQRNKLVLQDACLLHYNLDPEAVQRFCGGRWMGEQRRSVQMLRTMTHVLPDDVFLPFAATMVDGIPNCLYGNLTAAELDANLSTPNLLSVWKIPELIGKVITKLNDKSAFFTLSE